MKDVLSDTDPETERVHLDLMRRASPSRKIHLALSLSETVIALSRDGLARRFPDAPQEEIALRWVALHYGSELADEVRTALAAGRLTDSDVLAALAPVLRLLHDLGVRHFVGGSIASSAHGVARASIDGDVVTELGAEHVVPIVKALSDTYYVSEARVRDAIARRASFNLIHLDTMLKIDVFVSRDRAFDRGAFERSRPRSIAGGLTLPICSAEDIVLAKLEWYRHGGEVSERQWADVMGVLRANGSALDLRYLRLHAAELGVVELLGRALEEAGLAEGP